MNTFLSLKLLPSMYINGIRNEQEILELLIKNVHTLTLYGINIDHEM